MKLELRCVTPVRAAHIIAILYSLLMLIFSLVMLAVLHVMPTPGGVSPEQQDLALGNFRGLLILYPLFGLLFGWIGGFVTSHLYNAVAARLGGFELEFASSDAPPGAPIA